METNDNTPATPTWPDIERRAGTRKEQEKNAGKMSTERAKNLLRAVIEGKTRFTPEDLQLRGKESISQEAITRLILNAKSSLYTTFIVSKMTKAGWGEETKDCPVLAQEESDEIEELLEKFDPNGFIRRMQEAFAETELDNEEKAKTAEIEIKEARSSIRRLLIILACGAVSAGVLEYANDSIIKKERTISQNQKALIEKLQRELSQAQDSLSNKPSAPVDSSDDLEEIFFDPKE